MQCACVPYVAAACAVAFWILFLVGGAPLWLMVLLWVPTMSWYGARILEQTRATTASAERFRLPHGPTLLQLSRCSTRGGCSGRPAEQRDPRRGRCVHRAELAAGGDPGG